MIKNLLNQLNADLKETDAEFNLYESYGMLVGLICANSPNWQKSFSDFLCTNKEIPISIYSDLELIHKDTLDSLRKNAFNLEYLFQDITTILTKVTALSTWVENFLAGASPLARLNDVKLAEIMGDLILFTQIDEELNYSDAELDFSELVDFANLAITYCYIQGLTITYPVVH